MAVKAKNTVGTVSIQVWLKTFEKYYMVSFYMIFTGFPRKKKLTFDCKREVVPFLAKLVDSRTTETGENECL